MVQITWLGHGTFQFKLSSGEVVIIDPWFEGNPKHPAGYRLPKVDILLITHGHFDHIGDAVALARKDKPQVVANFEICHWLGSKGVENLNSASKGGTVRVGPLSVTLTHAIHGSGIQDGDRLVYGGEPVGFVLGFEDGRRAYFAGDTNVFSDMELIRELYEPELAFLPIGDLYTMSPREAAVACRLLRPRKVIPMHFGTFPPLTGRPDELAPLVTEYGTEIWTLEPGQPVEW